MVTLFLTRAAAAHTPGLSQSEFEVMPDGHVEARLTFATSESLGLLVIDRNYDGVVTESDVAAAHDDLRGFLVQGVDVDASGSRCDVTFTGASLREGDGLVLQASYACPRDADAIEVTLYYLSELPRAHREIAHIGVHDDRASVAEAVLTGDHRSIALRVPRAGGRARGESHFARVWSSTSTGVHVLLLAAAAVFIAGWAGLVWRRRTAARRKAKGHVNSSP